MESVIFGIGAPTTVFRFFLATFAFLLLWPGRAEAQTLGPNVLPQGSFEKCVDTYVPWAGVDKAGNLHGFDGGQLGVGDDGRLAAHKYGPSAAAADLRGKGVQDLVIADTRGYFWYYPNSGTAKKPVFTQGEVMPIWLAEERTSRDVEGVSDAVPRIQLLDMAGSKKLDLIAGVYSGKLFHIPNVGSGTVPDFKPTYNRDQLLIPTHKKGVLWNNYMAPFLTTLFSTSNSLDLITGEGTYSANSIYLFRNTSSGAHPEFNEDRVTKIIPGLGREHLTPVVLDWNNDGKPDILTGDRTGYLTLFLNTSTDPSTPAFDAGTHVKIGGVEKLGAGTTVAVADLTGNMLPNLLIGRDDGTVLYAVNTGKLGAPDFASPATPLKGVLPPTFHHLESQSWSQRQAYGNAYELVSCVNPQVEPGFTFPTGEKSKYALKFWVWPHKITFPVDYNIQVEDEYREHMITHDGRLSLKLNASYRVHFWVKADGNVSNLSYRLRAASSNRPGFHGYDVNNPIHASTSWSEVTDQVQINNPDDKTVTSWEYGMQFRFSGQPTLYFDDLTIQEVPK